MSAVTPSGSAYRLSEKAGAWVDIGLSLPIFLVYHLGVVFLNIRNATDFVTGQLLALADGSRSFYLLITAAIGVVFAAVFGIAGRGQAFHPKKFVQMAIEGVAYAFLMRLGASYATRELLHAGQQASQYVQNVDELRRVAELTNLAGPLKQFAGAAGASPMQGPFVGLIMSLGAGFYEELTFRVVLFGLGAKLLVRFFSRDHLALEGSVAVGRLSLRAVGITVGWALVSALLFSGMHYIGAYGDKFDLTSFVFRFVLGLLLTLIYALRGFSVAVWSHAFYDIWVLVF